MSPFATLHRQRPSARRVVALPLDATVANLAAIASIAALTALTALPAHAAPDASRLRAAALAATCANCHGTAGRAVEASVVPGLAGQTPEALRSKLLAFKAGTLPATVMHQISRGYSDAQLAALADWFAAQKP